MKLYRCDVRWTIADGAEEAMIGLWMTAADADGLADVGAVVGPELDTWWGGGQSGLHADTVDLLGLKVNEVELSTGLTIASLDQTIIGGPGTASGGSCPAETSICVSLRTGLASARRRGRVFLPPPATGGLKDDGDLSGAFQLAATVNLSGLLVAINADGSTTLECVVYSRTDRVTQAITQTRCGRVCDVMRSRRRSLVESYISTNV